MATEAYIGADLGGTNFRVGVRLRDENDLLAQESALAHPTWGPEDVLEQLQVLWRRLRERTGPLELLGVGFGSTGDIDFRNGTCHSMKRFPGLEAVGLGGMLRERFVCPATLLNDGLCAALGELRAGAGRGVSDFVMITLGTGIGGGVVLDGRLLTGSRGRVGKVGHQIVAAESLSHCHCGLPGCWQSLAGKQGVLAIARGIAQRNPGSPMDQALRAPDVDVEAVGRLAEAGDRDAVQVMRETGQWVGIGLANLVKLFAPERVLVGGGVAERNRVLLQAAQETVHAYAIKPYQRVPVLSGALGKDAGLVGATFLPEWSQQS